MDVPIMAEPIATTTALHEASIRARVRGFLKEIHFREGADVKKDQLLFVIDEAPFKAKLAEAQAKLEEAEASLKKARDSKAREVAVAQLALDQALLTLSDVEERREQTLLKRNASTVEDVQRKQALHKKDVAQMEADQASLVQTKADYDSNILGAQASVAGAKARVADAEIDLSYCRMFSPIDGRIGLAQVKLGNLVGPATAGGGADYTELAVVRQLNPMGVDIQAASRYLDRVARLISQGLPIEIFRPGLEGEEARRFPGKVTVMDNTINSATSTFLLRAEVSNSDDVLLPGEYVKVVAKVGEVKNAIVVPEQAVVESQAGPTVYTVDAQGKVAVVPVKATFTYQGQRVIESGLEPGQQVIVEGLQLVRSGITVKTSLSSTDALREPEGSSPAPPATAPAATKEGAKASKRQGAAPNP
jgi:RND family efflux transporter MFP subunit